MISSGTASSTSRKRRTNNPDAGRRGRRPLRGREPSDCGILQPPLCKGRCRAYARRRDRCPRIERTASYAPPRRSFVDARRYCLHAQRQHRSRFSMVISAPYMSGTPKRLRGVSKGNALWCISFVSFFVQAKKDTLRSNCRKKGTQMRPFSSYFIISMTADLKLSAEAMS